MKKICRYLPNLISHLSVDGQKKLLDDVNYLNLSEIRSLCERFSIPYKILIEKSGVVRKSAETDRKAIVLNRIRHFLKTGRIPEATILPSTIVATGPVPVKLRPSDQLLFGHYDKKETGPMMTLMKKLTGGRFKDGAIARILIHEYWAGGNAPTFEQFAGAWLKADQKGLGEHPEAAWLFDRARQQAGANWKTKRQKIAKRVLAQFERIASGNGFKP